MLKYKYVVVDWESWGVEAQSSSKIIACDPFSVREEDECSLQGTDPATKRPMLFQGHVLAIFEDATDAKSAVEAPARQLFSSEELQNSSVTGLQCNKDYEARPGLSPSRWSILEGIVLRKGFTAATRSSVRKDLGLVLKKARANKENKAKCRGQEQREL
ncbi:uncharacterized protein [Pocillopora verrucosa]|uniref:uncharacterized protein n=1 Tax=Pocillopora verrucosa TaxID=203993 RepID=UPI0033414E35